VRTFNQLNFKIVPTTTKPNVINQKGRMSKMDNLVQSSLPLATIPKLRNRDLNNRSYMTETDGRKDGIELSQKRGRGQKPLSFLDAIQRRQKVTMHIRGDTLSENCNCDGCVPPINDFDYGCDDNDDDDDNGSYVEDNSLSRDDRSDDETESEDDEIVFRRLSTKTIVVTSSTHNHNNTKDDEDCEDGSIGSFSSGSPPPPKQGHAQSSSLKRLSKPANNQRRFDLVDTDEEVEEYKSSDVNDDDADDSDADSEYEGSLNMAESAADTSSDSSYRKQSPSTGGSSASTTNDAQSVASLICATRTINLVDTDSDSDCSKNSSNTSRNGRGILSDEASSFHSSSSSSVEIVEFTKPTTKKGVATARRPKPTKRLVDSNRESVTRSTFREFNRDVFGGKLSSVEVIWSKKLNTTAGQTRLLKGTPLTFDSPRPRLAKVELSTKVIDDESKLRSTLLHELIHAAVWILEGVSKPPHGKEFKRWASLAMRRIHDVEVTTTHSYEINYRYAWACTNPKCSFLVKRHSRSVDTTKHICGRCKSSLIEVASSSSNGTTATPKKQAKPSAYNLFVKDQSKIVRQELMQEQRTRGIGNPTVAQSDVMKECARRWRYYKQHQSK
jgi:predicted SprT family Zn-dependent metalloprotease